MRGLGFYSYVISFGQMGDFSVDGGAECLAAVNGTMPKPLLTACWLNLPVVCSDHRVLMFWVLVLLN